MTLDWIDQGKALDDEYDALCEVIELARQTRAAGRMTELEWREAAAVFAERIHDLNRRVNTLNAIVPHTRFQRPPYPIAGDLERL